MFILGENKHQESIQRHQKPIFRYLTWLYLVQLKILSFSASRAGRKTQNRAQNPKILIVGENKYQEWIQRHQKPLFRHLTCHNWSILIFSIFQESACDQKNGRGQKRAWSLGTKLEPGPVMLIMVLNTDFR